MRPAGGIGFFETGKSGLIAAALAFAIVGGALPSGARGERPVPRVVNGLRTTAYPEVGAFLRVDDGRLDTSCSGTLVGCRTVVTAAHCFCGDDQNGDDCKPNNERRNRVFILQHAGIFELESIEIHPEFEFGVGGDIAVVRLADPVEGIHPAVINDIRRPPDGSRARIVGYGVTNATEYDAGVKRTGLATLSTCVNVVPRENHLCWLFDASIGPPGLDSNTCFGDSGGPLFADLDGRPRLAGVTSGGVSDGGCHNDRSFDTDVFFYRDWVRSTAGDDLGQTCGTVAPIGEDGAQVASVEKDLSVFNDRADLSFEVPPNTLALRVLLNGMDASPAAVQLNTFHLAVRHGAPPTRNDADCEDDSDGPFGYCSFANPTPGTWHASALWEQGYGTIQLTASIFGLAPTPGPPTPTPTPTTPPPPTPPLCWGDCNSDGAVVIDEIITGITIGLGGMPLSLCVLADADGSKSVTVDELITALNAALRGCRPIPTAVVPTTTRTPTGRPTSAATRTPTPTATPREPCDGGVLDALTITGTVGQRGPNLAGTGRRDRDLVLPPGASLESLELALLRLDKQGQLTTANITTFGISLRLLRASSVEAQLAFRFASPVPGTASAVGAPLAPPDSSNEEAVMDVLLGDPLPDGTTEDIRAFSQVGSAGTGSVSFVAELRAVGRCQETAAVP